MIARDEEQDAFMGTGSRPTAGVSGRSPQTSRLLKKSRLHGTRLVSQSAEGLFSSGCLAETGSNLRAFQSVALMEWYAVKKLK
jgi:hypothetical protein